MARSGPASGVVDWAFRNRETGEITIAQAPNPPLWIFIACWVLRLAVPGGGLRTALGVIGTLALVWWALDELVRGVNPWRRFLGGTVLLAIGVGHLTR